MNDQSRAIDQTAWHVVGDYLENGERVPEVGHTLEHPDALMMRQCGLHACSSLFDVLWYTENRPWLCQVRMHGVGMADDTTIVATRRTILWKIDFRPILEHLREFCARRTWHFWCMPKWCRDELDHWNDVEKSRAFLLDQLGAGNFNIRKHAQAMASAIAGADGHRATHIRNAATNGFRCFMALVEHHAAYKSTFHMQQAVYYDFLSREPGPPRQRIADHGQIGHAISDATKAEINAYLIWIVQSMVISGDPGILQSNTHMNEAEQ